jgi:hypothetical protein
MRKLRLLAACAVCLIALTGCNVAATVTNIIDKCGPQSTIADCFTSLTASTKEARYLGDTVGR